MTRSCVFRMLFVSAFCLCALPSYADWRDWWKTPEQQAAELYNNGDAAGLVEQAPNAMWKGLGQHATGDHAAAAESFAASARMEKQQGQTSKQQRALYNEATSEVHAGRYSQAIEKFKALLDDNPDYQDATHNLAVAEQLQQLQDQQSGGQSSSDGDSGSDSNSSDSADSGDNAGSDKSSGDSDQQNSMSESGSEQSTGDGSAANSAAEDSSSAAAQSNSTDDAAETGLSEQQERQDAEAAASALAAESEKSAADNSDNSAGNDDAEDGEANAAGTGESDADDSTADEQSAVITAGQSELSEQQQAIEQWLRQIPDDPSGLLRRKLEQSHRNQYPEVRGRADAW